MAKSFNRLANFRSNLYYSQPLYIPGYVYSPWKLWGPILLVIVLLAIAIFGFLWQKDQDSNENSPITASNSQSIPEQTIAPSVSTPESAKEAISDDATYYDVNRVVDGDTIEVMINGTSEKVRIIGVDTPETVDPRKTVQCFGAESSNYVKNLLNGKKVALEVDSSQGDTDRYNRLLRYVYLPGGIDVGKQIISEGYGHEYTYNLPYKYQSHYKNAEQQARNKNAGLWSPHTCNGNTT